MRHSPFLSPPCRRDVAGIIIPRRIATDSCTRVRLGDQELSSSFEEPGESGRLVVGGVNVLTRLSISE